MLAKRWFFNILLLSGIMYGFAVSVNVLIDPYGVFKTNIFYLDKGFNERFLKIELLKQNKKRYNSYILGSSRVGSTFPDIIEQYIPDSRFYNFSVIYGNIIDANKIAAYLVANDFPVENIYFQIDMDAMSSKIPEDAYYEKQYNPDVEQTSELLFYMQHLIIFPWGKMMRKVSNHFSDDKHGYYDLETGVMYRLSLDKKIAKDHELYIANTPSFHETNERTIKIEPEDYALVMKNLKHLVRLCDENGINLILYTTPLNHNTMDKFTIDSTLKFIKDIANIHDVWYFSGYNSVTMDNHNHYEASHYLYYVSKWIAARMFDDKTVNVPSDFGVLLTKENIQKSEIGIKENMLQYDREKKESH